VDAIQSLDHYIDKDLLKQRCQQAPAFQDFQNEVPSSPEDFDLKLWRLVDLLVNHSGGIYGGGIAKMKVMRWLITLAGLIPVKDHIPRLILPMHQFVTRIVQVTPTLPKDVGLMLQQLPEWLNAGRTPDPITGSSEMAKIAKEWVEMLLAAAPYVNQDLIPAAPESQAQRASVPYVLFGLAIMLSFSEDPQRKELAVRKLAKMARAIPKQDRFRQLVVPMQEVLAVFWQMAPTLPLVLAEPHGAFVGLPTAKRTKDAPN
jgi:hypothetical protein